MKCCVYTRCFFENEYLTFFIKHYINLGFNKIIILHSGGPRYNLSEQYLNLVDIYYLENDGDELLLKCDYIIKNSNFDWILSVDNDELLLLNKYTTIHDYIEEKLLFNEQINAFYFRWGMIEKCDIENINKFSHILKKYKVFSNEHIKTMFKKNDLISIETSHCVYLNNLTIYFENNILYNNQPIHPVNENSYKDHVLIHLHTRCLNDLVFKSFNTLFHDKIIELKDEFIEFINTIDQDLSNDTVQCIFLKYIGMKAKLPFAHSNGKLINMFEFNILKYNDEIVETNQNINILNLLKNNNINNSKYFYFINKLSNKIINDKTFIY